LGEDVIGSIDVSGKAKVPEYLVFLWQDSLTVHKEHNVLRRFHDAVIPSE
jgi:hypothetical protein